MKTHKITKNAFATLLTLVAFAVCSPKAGAIQIGPGAGLAGATNADGAGGRTNVEQDFVNLSAATYDVLDFEFNAVNTSGTVQPFLAELTNGAPRQYTPIWVGPVIAPGATGTITDTYISGTQQFTLPVAADIYAGFVMTENAVGFANGGVTDHNGAPPLVPIVGVQFATFTNNDLGRSYAFAVNVEEFVPPPVIPEPSTFAMFTLGGLALAARSRRRSRIRRSRRVRNGK